MRATLISVKVKSCNALLRLLLAYIRSYLNSVWDKFTILGSFGNGTQSAYEPTHSTSRGPVVGPESYWKDRGNTNSFVVHNR